MFSGTGGGVGVGGRRLVGCGGDGVGMGGGRGPVIRGGGCGVVDLVLALLAVIGLTLCSLCCSGRRADTSFK